MRYTRAPEQVRFAKRKEIMNWTLNINVAFMEK